MVRHDRTLEQIVFPIPEICEYLPEDYKTKIYNTVEKDDQGSKVADFFSKSDIMFEKMQWQKKLRSSTALFMVSKKESFWSYIIFGLSLVINLIVASFYPFSSELPGNSLVYFQRFDEFFPQFQFFPSNQKVCLFSAV